MSLEAAVYARLAAVSAVTDLVSTRIYPGNPPQSVTPAQSAISFRQVSGQAVSKFGADSALTRARVQVDCWAAKYDDARAIAAAVAGPSGALRRYRGTSASVVVQDTYVLNDATDLFEPDVDVHHVAVDIEVIYEAS